MDDPYQVWVNVGELFSDCFDELINNKQKKNKLKPMISIQQSLGDRFFQITGFRVDDKVFLAASRSFTTKFKKNNGRHKHWKCAIRIDERVGLGFQERIAEKTTQKTCTTTC